jgi:hypothetical protein
MDNTADSETIPLVFIGGVHVNPRCVQGRRNLVLYPLGLPPFFLAMVEHSWWALASALPLALWLAASWKWPAACSCGYYDRIYAEARADQAEWDAEQASE